MGTAPFMPYMALICLLMPWRHIEVRQHTPYLGVAASNSLYGYTCRQSSVHSNPLMSVHWTVDSMSLDVKMISWVYSMLSIIVYMIIENINTWPCLSSIPVWTMVERACWHQVWRSVSVCSVLFIQSKQHIQLFTSLVLKVGHGVPQWSLEGIQGVPGKIS